MSWFCLAEVFWSAYLAPRNGLPDLKWSVELCGGSKTAISKDFTSVFTQQNLIATTKVGIVHLKNTIFAVVSRFVVQSRHLGGEDMVKRHLLNGFLASVCAALSACIARNSQQLASYQLVILQQLQLNRLLHLRQ